MTHEIQNSRFFYIIRHGETEYNKLNMVQGSGIDSSLNEKGRAQAAAFFENYKNLNFDKLYTSTLKRTHQSIAAFIAKGIAWEKHHGFDEISWGNREGRILTPQDDAEHAELLQSWKNGDVHAAHFDGESPFQVMKRQKDIMDRIISRHHEKNILICMHGRALRILLCYLLDQNISQMEAYLHHNLGLYILEYSQGKFSLLLENDLTHLAQLNSLIEQKP